MTRPAYFVVAKRHGQVLTINSRASNRISHHSRIVFASDCSHRMPTRNKPLVHRYPGGAPPHARTANDAAPGPRFYDRRVWRRLRKVALRRDGYRCTVCGISVSKPGKARVDHIKPVRTHPHLALSLANLRSLCADHDNKRHWEKGLRSGVEKRLGCDASGLPLDPRHHWQKEKNLLARASDDHGQHAD
jgi:HNH endonuclease